ncbi:siderophore-interacting protein [Microbacterium sp. NPDC008134]|uniref:siderophore-interacting protein n=1 Tax=Microbacterium sp. NPDC008134 TaxID=3364183 RepID=UPI0036E58263
MRTEDVTPLYRRVVFTSDSFDEGFPIRHFAVSDHVKLFFPHPQTGVLVFPQITENGWEYPDGAGDPFFRDYTVRDYDADARELAIDFVLHDHGVAGRWAGRARPGDEIGQLGPRGHVVFPSDYPRYLAAGDATALPAIARLLEEAPEGSRVTAVIEVESAAEQQRLDVAPGVDADIVWVRRDEAVIADGHLSALETAVRDVAIAPGERLFVFVAGEAGMLKPIRRYLRRELGLTKEQVDVDGYWKRGVANLDHHADADDADD